MYSLIIPMLVAALPMGAVETRPRMAVLGFGSCDSALLQTATREVRASVSSGAPHAVLDEDATAAPGGRLPRASLEEVRRQVDAAKREFLNLDVPRSEKLFATALDAIERLPLGPQRWELWVGAKVNFARMLQYAGREEDAIRQFLEILWLKEDFELNRSEFPPSTRELLERTRVLLHAQPRHELEVQSRQPGATVFLNGYAVGRTPYKRSLPLGDYQVVVGDGARQSFTRRVELNAPRRLEVDLATEGRLQPQRGPCLLLDPDATPAAERALRLSLASQLAAVLDVEQIVAVRLTREGGTDGELYVAAALVDRSGREIREGREELHGEQLPDLRRLSTFVLTGEQAAGLAFVAAPMEPEGDGAPFRFSFEDGTKRWMRIAGIALGGAAVLLAGGALVSHVQAMSHQRDLDALFDPNGALRPADLGTAKRLKNEDIPGAEMRRTIFAVGAGAMAVGAGVIVGVSFIDIGGGDSGDGAGVALMTSGTF